MEKKVPSSCYASRREQELLVELYAARKDILEDKKTEFSMKGKIEKAEAWRSIEKQYNLAALGPHKNIVQLKRMWQHMKGRAKKEYVQEKKEAMRTGGGLPKPGEGAATASTIQILSTISQELESPCNNWDSDSLPSVGNCSIDLKQLADEDIIIVGPGITQRVVSPVITPCATEPAHPAPLFPPASPSTTQPAHSAPLVHPASPPSTTQPAHPASSASTLYTRTLTPQEASLEDFLDYRHKEHEMDMKIKAIELKIKEADLVLKDKDANLKDADLQIKEFELKIKQKEYLIKKIYLENLST